jgi:hypothetical protein
MGTEAQHKPGVWSVHGVRPESVGGQRYGSIGHMIEVDEVLPEVFERKEIIRRNGKNLSQTKPKDISESLL